MKQFKLKAASIVIIFFLVAGIFTVYYLVGRKHPDGAETNLSEAAGTVEDEGGAAAAGGDDASLKAAMAFSDAFKTIEKTSLDEDIEFFLWETAMSEDSAEENAAQSSSSSLSELAERYTQILSTDGVHYIEHSNALGMDIETEYWIKDGKFKIFEKSLEQVRLFDGEYYYVINLDEKTALRAGTDEPNVMADINEKTGSMLPRMANAGYSQESDQKVGSFDCSVFYLDIEFLGMKGNRLYVDKKTGMIVKNTYGDEETGMATEITEFQQGGFGDDIFTVPEGITIN